MKTLLPARWAIRLVVLVLSLCLFAPSVAAQSSRIVIDNTRISAWLEDSQSALKTPALAVGIVGPERDLFLDVFGDPGVDDAFLLGPLSRSVTALAFLLVLEDHEEHTLETAASHWFGAIPSEVTLGDLLRQSSGLETDSTVSPYRDVDASLDELLTRATWHPRSTVTDEDLHFALLGSIAADLAAQPFAELVQERLFDPLELTSASATPALSPRLVPGHQLYFGFPAERAEPQFNPAFVPALFISMSPRDMTTWLRFFLNEGSHDGAELIPPELLEDLSAILFRSTGNTATFATAMAIHKEQDFAAFVFANNNSWQAFGPTRILDGVIASLMQEEPPRGSNIEFLLRLTLGFFLLIALLNFLYEFVRWFGIRSLKLNGRQIGVVLGTTLFTASATTALHVLWMPLPILFATQPDLAIAVLLFASLLPLARLFGGFIATYRADAGSLNKYFGFS